MNFGILESILIILMIALAVTLVFRYLHLPVILGYLVVGTLVGPHLLAWLPNTQNIRALAEFGVVLLMFTVGLEFSLSKLLSMKYLVFILGGSQVLLSTIITIGIGLLLGMTLLESFVVGSIVAMSSTAIVIKQLSEQLEMNSTHGLNAVSILLFQDLAVIPMLILIPSLGTHDPQLWKIIAWAALKGIIAITLIIGLGHWLLKSLVRLIAATKVAELFTLIVLFISIGAAWLTHALGISYALGAFLAGIMLAETEFRHQIKVEIRPFRDILLGLFFISIGMLVNLTTWYDTWIWISLLVIALVLGKILLIALLCRLYKQNYASALRTGIVLAQGGEFGFAILTLALSYQLLPEAYGQVILAALLISFAIAPILIRYNQTLGKLFFPKSSNTTNQNT